MQLDRAFALLAENPMLGQPCNDLQPGYRKFQQGSHLIYYRLTDLVEVIRILHQGMDPEFHLT